MKNFIIVVIAVVIAVGGYYLYKKNYSLGGTNQNSNTNSSAAVETNIVNISNFAFDPASISVKTGDAISFNNQDGTDHTVTADGGNFNQQVGAGKSATITITNAGNYAYHCAIHPSMKGTIEVK